MFSIQLFTSDESFVALLAGTEINPVRTSNYYKNVHNVHLVGNISSRLSSNSKASASELVDNPEEMSPRYYSHNNALANVILQPQSSV